ncbi:MAG: retropepsin-like aspartic protease [Candidatus Omnitrophica bacterium]|nr:retropepsin-like aspartic protease [Candidatus Omnitrophota bacterium]
MIYLNTGGSISGIITRESATGVEAEIGAGTIVINRADIKSMHHASAEALADLRDKWAEERSRLKLQEKSSEEDRGRRLKAYENWVNEEAKSKTGKAREEGEVKVVRDPDSQAILVSAILDGEVKALLELDTGASLVILSKHIGDKLGVDMSSETKRNIVGLRLVGGQIVKARTVILKSIAIEGVEERDVLAAVMLEDAGPADLKDGLLGRSFLGRFNIRLDMQKMSMSLQKLK